MAKVVEKKGDRATVSFEKNGACGSCTACHVGEENMQENIVVLNEANANIGDWVEIELADSTVLNAAVVLYVIPLVIFMLTMLSSYGLITQLTASTHAEAISAVIGLIAVVITYIWINTTYEDNDESESKYLSSITRIIENDNISCNHYTQLEDNYDEL